MWTVLILILLCLPDREIPAWSWRSYIPFFDKWAHAILFGVLGLLWSWWMAQAGRLRARKALNPVGFAEGRTASRHVSRRNLLFLLMAGLLYAALTEGLQGWLAAGRQADPLDFAADAAGLIGGIGLYLLVGRKRQSNISAPGP